MKKTEDIEEEKQAVLKQSIDWIMGNPKADLFDLPRDLLEQWIDVDYGESFNLEESENTLPMCAFLTSLIEKSGGELSISEEDLIEKYHLWQIKLNIRSMHDAGLIKLENSKIALFSFDSEEEYKFSHVESMEEVSKYLPIQLPFAYESPAPPKEKKQSKKEGNRSQVKKGKSGKKKNKKKK